MKIGPQFSSIFWNQNIYEHLTYKLANREQIGQKMIWHNKDKKF